ncbi:MAG: hypothetical protein ACOCWQ_05925 [Nanoarchaeota archaeon]
MAKNHHILPEDGRFQYNVHLYKLPEDQQWQGNLRAHYVSDHDADYQTFSEQVFSAVNLDFMLLPTYDTHSRHVEDCLDMALPLRWEFVTNPHCAHPIVRSFSHVAQAMFASDLGQFGHLCQYLESDFAEQLPSIVGGSYRTLSAEEMLHIPPHHLCAQFRAHFFDEMPRATFFFSYDNVESAGGPALRTVAWRRPRFTFATSPFQQKD